MYSIVYSCCVAVPPKPDKPTVKIHGVGVIITIEHPPSPGNVSVAVQCFIKYRKDGDEQWQFERVPNCASVSIPDLTPGSHYTFILVVTYVGHEVGSGSDPVHILIRIRKFLTTYFVVVLCYIVCILFPKLFVVVVVSRIFYYGLAWCGAVYSVCSFICCFLPVRMFIYIGL